MLERENKISAVLVWSGIILIVAGLIFGLVLGRQDPLGLGFTYTQVWSVTILYWVSGFLSGMFFIALSEIIEQLHRLNRKAGVVPEEEELELLND